MNKGIASAAEPDPHRAGIGLRFPHHRHVMTSRPAVGWFEVHPENYMMLDAPFEALENIRADYPISLHAVGLSLGSVGPLDRDHLQRLAELERRIEPGLVSDHVSWSIADGIYHADLLPLPCTEEALDVLARHVDEAQAALGRRLLLENPSRYLHFTHSTLSEAAFLSELAARTGCGLLCDINNIFVSAQNLGLDAGACLEEFPREAVAEIHLAGHATEQLADGTEIRIDDHGSLVSPEVWHLYERAVKLFGPVPTLIEWDTNVPAFAVLQDEAAKAQAILDTLPRTEPAYARVA